MDVLRKFIDIYSEKSDENLTGANQDIKYALKQQRKRLEELGLVSDEQIEQAGALNRGNALKKSDHNLISTLYYQTCLRKTKIYKGEQKIYDNQEKQILYISEIDRIDKSDDKDVYACPACGAVSTVKTLLDGCPYCGSHFIIDDLYPIINNYYFLNDLSLSQKEGKKMSLKWCLSFALPLTACFVITYIVEKKSIIEIIFMTIMSMLLGSFIGYMAMSLKLLIILVAEAIKSIVAMRKIKFSFLKNKQIIKSIPGFSKEEFEGRIISAIKMIFFSDDVNNLSIYDGGPIKGRENIIDVTYGGAIGLRKCYVNDGQYYLFASVPLDNLYYINGKIKKKREYFNLMVHKDIKADENLDFSIYRIKCHNCSQSFDGRYQKKCPYCGSEYHLSEDDWVIGSLERV